jgi:hypothetical protein
MSPRRDPRHGRAETDQRRLPRSARRRASDGHRRPFTDTKEVIGGYALMQFASREQALEAARGFMDLHRIHWPTFVGECEVRPLEDM